VLGRVLGAPMLGTTVNPAAGRFPRAEGAIWAGGSLGGTMGLVYARSEPRITAAVLNVGGAAWTHYLTASVLYPAARLALLPNYGSDFDVHIAVGMAQINFDPVDGAVWDGVHPDRPMLLQQSMGDPVLPNIGTELAGAAIHAVQVGAVLTSLPGAMTAAMVSNGAAITQFKVPSNVTGNYQVHGFAAGDSIAGRAARAQITSFIQSVWAGSPVISVPELCMRNTPAGSCDFSTSTQ
jgi:hypothetical protein